MIIVDFAGRSNLISQAVKRNWFHEWLYFSFDHEWNKTRSSTEIN